MDSITFNDIINSDKETFENYIEDGKLNSYQPFIIPKINGVPGTLPLIRSPVNIWPLNDYLYENRRWFQIKNLKDLIEEFYRDKKLNNYNY